MTKPRPPVTIENTLFRVLGELGIERAAEVTGRSQDYLRALTDPDKREQLAVRDMIVLDRACRDAGDASRPLYETVGLILDADEAERFADGVAIGRHVEHVARECGEGLAAFIAAALSAGADPALLDDALRQGEEAHDAWTDAIATLRAQKNRAARAPEPPA